MTAVMITAAESGLRRLSGRIVSDRPDRQKSRIHAVRRRRRYCRNVGVHALTSLAVVPVCWSRARRRRADRDRRLRDRLRAEARVRKRVRAHWPPREYPRAAVGLCVEINQQVSRR